MKLVFLSNYISHHQKPLCDVWDKLTDKQFAFVSTEKMPVERTDMGWKADNSVSYEVFYNGNRDTLSFDFNLVDTVILGNASMEVVKERLKAKNIVYKYSERVFKGGYNVLKWFPRLYTYWNNYGRYKSLYLLAASAYATADFALHGTFIGKSYKWGYFTETKQYDIENLLLKKETTRILWCGRLIDWKHPEICIEVAKYLRNEGYIFSIDIVGLGELEGKISKLVTDNNLSGFINILGAMSPEQVRMHMEKAGIYIFTSDFKEGWGAVLNEAMNSGCAVVASHAIGSVPFLIKHGINGLIYQNGNLHDLCRKVKTLLNNVDKQRELGINAYNTITELWNPEVAAERFLSLSNEVADHGFCDLYEEGPCSKAPVIKNNWFRERDYDITWVED